VLAFFALTACHEAQAGPWVRETGKGYGRLAFARENVDGLRAERADIYAEYGLTSAWTLNVKAEQVRFPDRQAFDAAGMRATLRRSLWQTGRFRVAAEAGAVYGAAIGGVEGCDQLGGEARFSIGASGGGGERGEWYAFADLAGRVHAEQCWRNRAEFGIGRQVTGPIFVTQQYWLERGSDEARSDKLETAVVWRAGRVDLSLAWRREISGRFRENGVVVALARRF